MKKLVAQIAAFFRDEDGLETIEMVIILIVLVSVAFAFRRTLLNWYNHYIMQSTNPDLGVTPVSPDTAQ